MGSRPLLWFKPQLVFQNSLFTLKVLHHIVVLHALQMRDKVTQPLHFNLQSTKGLLADDVHAPLYFFNAEACDDAEVINVKFFAALN